MLLTGEVDAVAMARIIPPQIGPQSEAPPGEKLLFEKFQDSSKTSGWVVLHSLDVAEHRQKPSGELDFVITVPEMGVLCIEVKSHQHIRCEDGKWFFGKEQRPGESPFKQVRGAMYGLLEDFKEKNPDLGHVPFWPAVCFPFIHFNQDSVEWHSWQIIDAHRLQVAGVAEAVHNVLKNARRHLEEQASAPWFDSGSVSPTPGECRRMADALRPQFEFFESPASRARRRSEEIKEYTERQLVALDAMHAQDRVFFTGPAGTGKTFLALEAARRAAAQGEEVLFLCFNRLLGEWLDDQMRDLDRVDTGTLHSLMLQLTNESVEGDESPEFWNQRLPHEAASKMLRDEEPSDYDRLIVDEAQDILKETYLDVLELLVDGGLQYGKWVITGDFSNQSIYGGNYFEKEVQALTPKAFLSEIDAWAPILPLRRNCRNTPRVANAVEASADLDPGYSSVLRPDTGIDPQFYAYSDDKEQRKRLLQLLNRLYELSYRAEDIVLLSPCSSERSIASKIQKSPWGQRLQPYEGKEGGYVRYTSIHAFKGLESPVIVVTDVDSLADPEDRELFYIAGSRSQERLIVLVAKEARDNLLEIALPGS